MQDDRTDWLKVVYGRDLRDEGARRPYHTEIAVRQTPSEIRLGGAAGSERRVRVSVVASDPAQPWTLWLRDFGAGPGEAPAGRVWWRIEPGTWQPLTGTRQCVAEGRGRMRVDVALRLDGEPASPPHLRFVAELAWSGRRTGRHP